MEETANITTETKAPPVTPEKTAPMPETVKTDVKDTKEVKPESKKYKVKVEGKETEVTEEELLRGYSHATAANKKFQEAAMTRKQAEEFIGLLKTNPKKVLTDPRLGVDFRKLAEEYLIEEMERDQWTPEQKELSEVKAKLAAAEEEKKAFEKTKQDAEMAALTQKYTDEFTKDVMTTLKGSGLPQTENTVRRMAYYMHQALLRGYELKAVDVLPLVKEDYNNDIKALFSELDGDTLMGMLGDGVVKKISDAQLSKLKTVGKKVASVDQGVKETETEKPKKLSKEEWRKKLEAI